MSILKFTDGLRKALRVANYLEEFLEYEQSEELRVHHSFDVYVNCLQNCREQGLTFCATTDCRTGEPLPFERWVTFCVYEHRNSDGIIINCASECGWNTMAGALPYLTDSKWDYLEDFQYNKEYDCAKRLMELLLEVSDMTKPLPDKILETWAEKKGETLDVWKGKESKQLQ